MYDGELLEYVVVYDGELEYVVVYQAPLLLYDDVYGLYVVVYDGLLDEYVVVYDGELVYVATDDADEDHDEALEV